MSMNYWTGRSGDKASEYFGDVTRESLINFQTGYMKLDKQELYDKKGKYVGCGPSTAKSLNTAYKLLNNSYVPEQAKNGIMGMGKSPENNSAYNWDIKAGVYNAYVKEAQVMLMNMGYRLPKYGADGKWSNSGETYEALLGFQKSCKSAFEGVKKNGNAGNLKPVEHFQGIEPTGSLDQRTYAALQKEKTKKVNVNYNNTAPKKVENGKKGTGKDNSLVDSFTSGFKGFFTNQYEYYKGKIQKAYTDPLEAAKENFKEAIIPPTYKIQMGIVNNIKENAELVLSGDLNKIVEHGGEGIAEMVETGALALISGGIAKIAGKVTVAKMPEGASKSIFKNIDEGLNFASTPAKHMENPGRFVPTQTLQDAIKSTKGVADPRGSNAMMYYTTMTKNGQTYNLEVLYDKATNTVYHFEYTRKAIGNLPAIPK